VLDHNPLLGKTAAATETKGGPATIEDPARAQNLRWQTRPAPLTAEENALADALQKIFADEIYSLEGIVQHLNRMSIAPPAGAAQWTEASFRAEMARLAG
jgi:hypothetical protein